MDMNGMQNIMQMMNQFSGMMPKSNKVDAKQVQQVLNKYYQMGKISAYESILLKIKTGATIDDIRTLCEVIKEIGENNGEF